ncbi:hypothetical protein KAU11_06575 [Candidatus Babeliales bacterium]|nr:hypothetical protein [Candidatus Babeliales bacterium]
MTEKDICLACEGTARVLAAVRERHAIAHADLAEAARSLRAARGNYSGPCADLSEIRRVVKAGKGSNVSSVTEAWNQMEEKLEKAEREIEDLKREIERYRSRDGS